MNIALSICLAVDTVEQAADPGKVASIASEDSDVKDTVEADEDLEDGPDEDADENFDETAEDSEDEDEPDNDAALSNGDGGVALEDTAAAVEGWNKSLLCFLTSML